jgi:uncharacterized membrane protein YoaK (UPF0700 family)
MPVHTLRALTALERTSQSNRRLGCTLAFVAGAVNAGGFFAVGQYTSHMSGIVSTMADELATGNLALVLAGLSSLISFLSGAATSAVLINWGRRRETRSRYAIPLMFEAILLLCFGMLGANLEHERLLYVPLTVDLLCFVMGLQNAMVTKISRAEIRTTHVTGLVTDIGIELGKLLYWNGKAAGEPVVADRARLSLLTALFGMFFFGALAGAFGFTHIGFVVTVPLACLLVLLAIVPIIDDLTEAGK